MSAASAWATAVLLIVGGVVLFQQLGLDLGSIVVSVVHGVEHWLGSPLTVL